MSGRARSGLAKQGICGSHHCRNRSGSPRTPDAFRERRTLTATAKLFLHRTSDNQNDSQASRLGLKGLECQQLRTPILHSQYPTSFSAFYHIHGHCGSGKMKPGSNRYQHDSAKIKHGFAGFHVFPFNHPDRHVPRFGVREIWALMLILAFTQYCMAGSSGIIQGRKLCCWLVPCSQECGCPIAFYISFFFVIV